MGKIPGLAESDLTECDLAECDLAECDLSECDLAELPSPELSHFDLFTANLICLLLILYPTVYLVCCFFSIISLSLL